MLSSSCEQPLERQTTPGSHRQNRVVTGGSRGLGLQMAEALGEMGASVALVARSAEELDEARAQLRSRWSVDALTLPCDLSDAAAIPPLVERAARELGPIDILVNNAGTTWGAATLEHPLEAWQKVVNLNLTATFLMCQEVGRRCMVPRRQRQDRQYRLDPRPHRRRRSRPAGDTRLQHDQGRRRQLHTLAGRGMGAIRHYRERYRARVLSRPG